MKQNDLGVTSKSIGSAKVLVANTTQTFTTRYYNKFRYCDQRHWSDECQKYRTVDERKQFKDSCYKCLKVGHMSKEFKQTKASVYCREINTHHRNLCPQKFKENVSGAHLTEEFNEEIEGAVCAEESFSSSEAVLMQPAKTEIKNVYNVMSEQVRILLKSG